MKLARCPRSLPSVRKSARAGTAASPKKAEESSSAAMRERRMHRSCNAAKSGALWRGLAVQLERRRDRAELRTEHERDGELLRLVELLEERLAQAEGDPARRLVGDPDLDRLDGL